MGDRMRAFRGASSNRGRFNSRPPRNDSTNKRSYHQPDNNETYDDDQFDEREETKRKRPFPPQSRIPAKKPFGLRKDSARPEREPAFKKEVAASVISTTPLRRFVSVYVSNEGCQELGRICYKTLLSKNTKLATIVTEETFLYVIHLAFMNRLVQTACITGVSFPEDSSRLKQVASTIELPDIICQYIESVGIVEMSNGAKVSPWCPDSFSEYVAAGNTNYHELVIRLHPVILGLEKPWGIYPPMVEDYNANIARGKPGSINFRTIAGNDVCLGKKEMLISYRKDEFGLTPLSPEKMSESDAQRGAIYHFRQHGGLPSRKLVGSAIDRFILHPSFQTAWFEWGHVFAKMCSDSFAGPR